MKPAPAPPEVDVQAFAELVSRYQDPVYRLLFHFTGNPAEATVLTREAFVDVFRKMHGRNSAQPLPSLIFTTALERASTAGQSRPLSPLAPEALLRAGVGESSGEGGDETSLRNGAAALHLQLQHLPEAWRGVFILSTLLHVPLPQVAELLNIPADDAESRWRAATDRLRERLAGLP